MTYRPASEGATLTDVSLLFGRYQPQTGGMYAQEIWYDLYVGGEQAGDSFRIYM